MSYIPAVHKVTVRRRVTHRRRSTAATRFRRLPAPSCPGGPRRRRRRRCRMSAGNIRWPRRWWTDRQRWRPPSRGRRAAAAAATGRRPRSAGRRSRARPRRAARRTTPSAGWWCATRRRCPAAARSPRRPRPTTTAHSPDPLNTPAFTDRANSHRDDATKLDRTNCILIRGDVNGLKAEQGPTNVGTPHSGKYFLVLRVASQNVESGKGEMGYGSG